MFRNVALQHQSLETSGLTLCHFVAYVDDQMVATGKIVRGAVLGLEAGGSVWAKSPGYDVRPR